MILTQTNFLYTILCVKQSNSTLRTVLESIKRVEYPTLFIYMKFDQNTCETKQRGGVIGHQLEYFRLDGVPAAGSSNLLILNRG